MNLTSFFPLHLRKIQYDIILDEFNNSHLNIDDISKVNFSLALVKNILEINKNINNENKTFPNIKGDKGTLETLNKLNKFILSIKNDESKEFIKLIAIMGNIYLGLTESQKSLTKNSYYQVLINASQSAIDHYISNKKNLEDEIRHESSSASVINIFSIIEDFINNTFENSFVDNKRIILECISNMDKVQNNELREILANVAVRFGHIYFKIIEKERELYNIKEEKRKNEKEQNKISLNGINQEKEERKEKKLLVHKIFSDKSILKHSLQNFVKVFVKTTIFNIEVEKRSFINEMDEFFLKEKSEKINKNNVNEVQISKNEIISEENIIENNDKKLNKVPGYNILFEIINNIKVNLIESVLIKFFLIEMYYHIENKKKVNSLFLEIKKESSFDSHYELFKLLINLLEKIKWFIYNDKDILEKETIYEILKFIKEKYDEKMKYGNDKDKKSIEKHGKKVKDKYNELLSILIEQNIIEDVKIFSKIE